MLFPLLLQTGGGRIYGSPDIAVEESYGKVMSICTLDTKNSLSAILCVDIKPKDVERKKNHAFQGN